MQRQPTNTNFLSPTGFRFLLNRSPNIEYFCQKFDFPSLTLNDAQGIQTPFGKIPVAGDHVTFGNFNITFKVDEDMNNYFEIYDWIISLGFPDSFDQYVKPTPTDASLMILDSSMNPKIKFNFTDIVPLSIGGMQFDTTRSDINYVTTEASFKYKEFTYERVV